MGKEVGHGVISIAWRGRKKEGHTSLPGAVARGILWSGGITFRVLGGRGFTASVVISSTFGGRAATGPLIASRGRGGGRSRTGRSGGGTRRTRFLVVYIGTEKIG